MPWGSRVEDVLELDQQLLLRGAATTAIEADLADVASPSLIFKRVTAMLGSVTALILAQCESAASSILDTSVESFDRHFAVNTRATWLLVREFARQFSRACQAVDELSA
jgi:3-oxoacyl-[acyl-carrier protein] reductase